MTLVHHPDTHKLGKGPVKTDRRNLKLASYIAAVPSPPSSDGFPIPVDEWPMYGNDQFGDCVPAGAGHETQLWTAVAGREVTPSLGSILQAYSAITGFRPDDPSTDQGTVVLDALNYRRHIGIEGHRIAAFAQINPRDTTAVKQAVWLFDAIGIGLALPITAQRQITWKVGLGADGRPGSWGGHYVPVIAYDHRHLWVVTWGEVKAMTWGFFRRYCDEAYALLSLEMLQGGRSPEGFDAAALNRDLTNLKEAA